MDPLTLTPSSVTFVQAVGNISVSLYDKISSGNTIQFPAPWAPFSTDPAIRVVVINHALTSPVALMLVDAYSDPVSGRTEYSIFAELTTAQPGQTVDEIVAGLPVTQMLLVPWPLSIDHSETGVGGFSVTATAFRL